MVTKLRNISKYSLTKFIAFIMVVALITTALIQLIYVSYLNINPESLLVEEYKDSQTEFVNEFNYAIHQTYDFINDFPRHIPNDLDYLYYIKTDGMENTNSKIYTKEFFASHKDAFFAYEKGVITLGESTNPSIVYSYPADENMTVYIAFPYEYIEEQQNIWEAGRAKLIPIAITSIASIVVALILIVYLIIVTGRKTQDDELHLSRVDRIYSEILIAGFIPLFVLWFGIMAHLPFYGGINNSSLSINQIYNMIFAGAVTAIVTALCGVLLLSIVRKIKARRFIKHSITYRVFHSISEFIKSFFDGSRFSKFPLTKSLYQRQIIFIVASAALVFFTFLFILIPPLMLIPPILEALVIYWYIKYNNITFEEINKGFNESLEEQMKSERMKIDLITNVSHDLKTPLTSIISYVDLLSKEEDLSDSARDYVNIIAEKSDRLKNIVADLFDLAKSTSGDINLDFETLDIKRLIEQTLGDMEDDIEKSGLQIKTKFPENPVNIVSDGKKLYRVFQNILDNALKYSLKGTRIYVELEEQNGKAIATVKNTADYEMDFTANEILQRFNRGDQSRTTEGSGLGLSIAESFTKVCGGDFKVDIDGDMFKVIITFG